MRTVEDNTVATVRAHSTGVRAIAAQFSSRGLVKAVEADTRAQEEREAATRAEAPMSYRISTLSDAALTGLYRKGKDTMSAADLVSYIQETRALRTRDADFSAAPVEDELVQAGEAEKAMVASVLGVQAHDLARTVKQLPQKLRSLPAQAMQAVRTRHTAWFDTSAQDVSKEQKRFPLSAFAALAAVAVSLMLIVASSVMVNHGEREVNQLTLQLSNLSNEVAELRSDLDVQNDLLDIRDIAVNEYGMVSEEFVKMTYLSSEKSDSIEAFEEEKEAEVGLSALLSAIGIK